MKASTEDRNFLIEEELKEKEEVDEQLRKLFDELDTSGSAEISLGEFESHMEDKRAQAYFNALDIDFDDVRTLFLLMDVDGSGSVDIEEFLQGCEKLKGDAKSIDLLMLHYEVRWLARILLENRKQPIAPP